MKLTPTIIAEKVVAGTTKAVQEHYDKIMKGEQSFLFATIDLGFGVRYNVHSSGHVSNEQLIMSCTHNGTVIFKCEYQSIYADIVTPALQALGDVAWTVISKEQDKVKENV